MLWYETLQPPPWLWDGGETASGTSPTRNGDRVCVVFLGEPPSPRTAPPGEDGAAVCRAAGSGGGPPGLAEGLQPGFR